MFLPLSRNHIHPHMHHFWLDLIIPQYWKLFDRVFVQSTNFFESICEKNQLDEWIKFTKNIHFTYAVQLSTCINIKKNKPWLRYLHVADVRYHLDCMLVHACWPGTFATTITTILVFCKCKQQHRWLDYECWSGASASNMHVCRHKFKDMAAG